MSDLIRIGHDRRTDVIGIDCILSFFSFQSRDLYILNIGTKNKSWWLEHGIGCRITNTSWQDDASVESSRPIPPEDVVEGCLLDYYYVECIHAGVQCLLAVGSTYKPESNLIKSIK